MANFEEHICKYSHNRNFYSFGISTSKEKFNDWQATVLFYAAVHLFEAIIFKNLSQHSRDHAERDRILNDNILLFPRDCKAKYTSLKALSQKARYTALEISDKDVYCAQEWLDYLAERYSDYINLATKQ